MELKEIALKRFKKIKIARISLSPINILVGGNNSGKSSILQGIHFSVVAAIAARTTGKLTFTQDNLLYCPARDFVTLRNGQPYQNQSNFSYLEVIADDEDQETIEYKVRIYRGRNEGNVGCVRSGSIALGLLITNLKRPFSIYVPGLAGVPQKEEFRTESIIKKGVASGDANLYLRNVIYLIKRERRLKELKSFMRTVFPEFWIGVTFNPKEDVYINVDISLSGPNGKKIPLELAGTGIQQALQIFSYTILFKPTVLLLDEPDSHLHPDNQSQLASVLMTLASSTNTKIIASTHSRHFVDALYDDANLGWLKDGKIVEQGHSLNRLSLLMDLGALDTFDKLREGEVDWVILSEDSSKNYIYKLAEASGFDMANTVIYTYKTSSQIHSAIYLAEFIRDIAPNTTIVVHRDRDFLTDVEIGWLSEKISNSGAHPFITEGCDIESYFIDPAHLAEVLDEEVEDVEAWIEDIATRFHNRLVHKFSRKRDEARYFYRNREEEPPDTMALLGEDNPLPPEKRLGKFMSKKVRGEMHEEFEKTVDIMQITPHLTSPRLVQILEENA